jgi:hypothetical protein
MGRVETLIARAEQCHREVALEYYNAFAGLQERLDVAAIVDRYPELHARDTWDYINELTDREADERARRFLRLAFYGFISQASLRDLTEALANAESEAVVEVDGEQVAFRALTGRMANEPDAEKRRVLDRKNVEVIASLNPLREEYEHRHLALINELGFTSVPELVRELKNLKPEPFAASCRAFLDRSDAVYEERLGQYANAAGLERSQVRHGDMGFMLRAGRFDELFPPREMVPALSKTLHGLGIDLDSQQNVTLDLEQRPRKTPRAFCIGIDTPSDVRLVLSPRGGQDDYSVLFHEAGHLEFAAHVSPSLPYYYSNHGDLSVHEGYAFLFQHLTSAPAWWHEIMGVNVRKSEDLRHYIDFARFQRLYLFRRYCAKLNYELEFYAGGADTLICQAESQTGVSAPPTRPPSQLPEIAHAYAKWLERGCGFAYPPERYLADFDDDLYVMQYLQAWVWEVQLRSHLEQRFGEAWFTSRGAGDLLRELWAEGMKYDAWELAQQLGMDGLDIEPLAQELLA